MRKIVAVDIDSTVVSLAEDSWNWLFQKMRCFPEPFPNHLSQISYDLSKEVIDLGYDLRGPYGEKISYADYWKLDDLYDEADPLPGSVEALEYLKIKGCCIAFVSHVEGAHSKSKYEFIKRHFPVDAYYATREKWGINAWMAIDDRNKYLNQLAEVVPKERLFKMETKFTQDEKEPPCVKVKDWYDFIDKVKEIV